MPVFSYTAQRSLLGSISPGDPINYTLRLTQQVPQKRTSSREIMALGGGKDTLVYHRLRLWSCTTGSLSQTQFNELLQFLDSCDNGVSFDMDEVPSTMEGEYSVSQVSTKPLYRVSFTVRQVI